VTTSSSRAPCPDPCLSIPASGLAHPASRPANPSLPGTRDPYPLHPASRASGPRPGIPPTSPGRDSHSKVPHPPAKKPRTRASAPILLSYFNTSRPNPPTTLHQHPSPQSTHCQAPTLLQHLPAQSGLPVHHWPNPACPSTIGHPPVLTNPGFTPRQRSDTPERLTAPNRDNKTESQKNKKIR